MKWIRRKNGKIVETASIKQSGMTEQVDEADQEYLDFKDAPFVVERQKQEAIIANLPDWTTVSTAVDNISNLADAKVFIKKLARVVYWLAKNSAT
uniref:Uncharacterized protein n=1 Tax=viral metagenome TaxID=1070528 RepID=A0A6M3ILL1_9ZZZZ